MVLHRCIILAITLFSSLSNCLSQTFNGQGGLPFPPFGTIGITESPATVTGIGILGGCTRIQKVTVNLSHTFDGDIALFLIAPNGVFLELSSGNGGAQDDYIVTEFRDDAPIFVTTGSPPFNGQFKAEGRQNVTTGPPFPAGVVGTFNLQNTFDGINADGDWILYLNDYNFADVGFLNSWSITFDNLGQSFTVNVGPDATICAGSTNVTLNANNTAPNPNLYTWSSGQTTPSITVSPPTTTTYTVTVTDVSGCTATDAMTLTILPVPTANPVSLTACAGSNGLGLFDLTASNNAIGGSQTVLWFNDPAPASPISNPNNFLTPTTTVYAVVVGSNGCQSVPVPIPLTVTPSNPAGFSMNIVDDAVCDQEPFQVNFTFPTPGTYTIFYELNCVSGTTTNSITTSNTFITLTANSNCTLRILSITNTATNCTVNFNPPLSDVILVEDVPSVSTNPVNICSGTTVNLADFITVNPGGNYTIHTTLPATPANQLSSTTITPTSSALYYVQAFNPLQACFSIANIDINVLPGGSSASGSQNLCQTDAAINLTQFLTPSTLTGIWSGQGVSGNFFNPTGLSGNIVLTFDPDNICYTNGTVNITVAVPQTPNLSTATLCPSDAPILLSSLADPLFLNGTWSGPGVNGSFFDPNNLSGIINLTFTPSTSCVLPASTTVDVLDLPNAIVQNNNIICSGGSFNLNSLIIDAQGNTITYHNAIPVSSANQINTPTIIVNNDLLIYVKATNSDGCFVVIPASINVTAGGNINLQTASVCQLQGTFNLNVLEDVLAGAGIWSGSNVNNGILNVTNQSGDITVTFTPSNTCFIPNTTVVNVLAAANANLNTANLCSSIGTYNLNNLVDPNYPDGVWSGPNVVGNTIQTTNLSGIINLSFDPSANCVNNATTSIQISQSQSPNLISTNLCASVESLDLNTLEDPLFSAGTWSGQGVTGNLLNTIGLTGNIPLTFASSQNCVLPATTSVNINPVITPAVTNFSICANASPVLLSNYVDALYAQGTWTGPGVSSGIFNPINQVGSLQLTFDSDVACTNISNLQVIINNIAAVNSVEAICAPNNTSYTVSFNISGGDGINYLVDGVASGNSFISPPINSNVPYNFVVSDNNLCGNISVQGVKNCSCVTSAGTMNFNNAPFKICSSQLVNFTHNGNQTLDNNDGFYYVLHDEAGPQLGNILLVSTSTTIGFPSNAELGKTYYFSAVAGDTLADGTIDPNSTCFSITSGVPVQFYLPEININSTTNVCAALCTDVNLLSSGEPPYVIYLDVIRNGSVVKKDTINTVSQIFNYNYCPNDFNHDNGTTSFSVVQFQDKNCSILPNGVSTNVAVNPLKYQLLEFQLCPDDETIVNGITYNALNPGGLQAITSNDPSICDSTLEVKLSFYTLSVSNFSKSICASESILINGTAYNNDRLTGQEIIRNGNVNGCDSLININLTLTNEVKLDYTNTLCDGESIVVNGIVFDASNPKASFTILASGLGQCDTLVNIDLKFENKKENNVQTTLCQGEFILVNNIRYDQNKTSGQEIISGVGSLGCDSTINVQLTFNAPSINNLTDSICREEQVVINGQVYDFNKRQGVEVIEAGNIFGCDSTINVQLYFYETVTDTIKTTLTQGETITINGIVFGENNTSGNTISPILTTNGCLKNEYVVVTFEASITALYETSNESCPNKNDGKIVISNISGCSDYSITLNNESIPIGALPIEIDALAPGNYLLKITGQAGCLWQESITILPSTSQPFIVGNTDYLIKLGQDVQLTPSIEPSPETIRWEPFSFLTCGDCPEPSTDKITEDIVYDLILTDDKGCDYSYDVRVTILKVEDAIVFPNAFSPNGDNNNDNFEILFTDFQKISTLRIFDRWGNKMFDFSPNPSADRVSWDGLFNGAVVQSGVYIYAADIVKADGTKSKIAGDLTIIR